MQLKNKFIFAMLSLLLLSSCQTIEVNNKTVEVDSVEVVMSKSIENTVMKLSGGEYTTLYNQVIKGVVTFINYQKVGTTLESSGLGSGFIYDQDSRYYYLMTNNHVVSGYSEMHIVTHTNQQIKVEVLGQDAIQDVAIARIDKTKVSDVVVLPISQEADGTFLLPEIGSPIFAIGNPGNINLRKTLTTGIVSGLNRSIKEKQADGMFKQIHAIQIDVAINPGNSGGPLFNMNGEIIGVNTLKITSDGVNSVEGINFSLPIHDMYIIGSKIRDNYAKTGIASKGTTVSRTSLGIDSAKALIEYGYYERLNLNIPQTIISGVVVEKMSSKTALIGNDNLIIVEFEGHKIENPCQLRWYLYEHEANELVKIKVYDRIDGQYSSLTQYSVTLIKETVVD